VSHATATPAAPLSRRDRKKERTRREIYEAAMSLFAKKGFAAVTIAEIAEAADVGRGTFFLHFPSKAALLYEFNQRFAEDFLTTLQEPRASAHEELSALVQRMGAELQAKAEIMTAMLSEFFSSPETIAAARGHGSALLEIVIEIITRGQKRGEFTRSIDPRLAAAAFFGTSSSIVSGSVFKAGEVTPQEVHRQFMQLTFSGLSPAGGGDPGKK
jgi:AcrR family transcriptional regulator